MLVSEALESAGIPAVLGGGGAVTHYSKNEYMSTDLDFITVERNRVIEPIVAKLGFIRKGKNFYHPSSQFFLEFPPGPLSFGDKYVDTSSIELLKTEFGLLRAISPTQCVMDRLAWVIHGNDTQAKEQAILVAKHQEIDWEQVYEWSASEGAESALVDEVRSRAASGR